MKRILCLLIALALLCVSVSAALPPAKDPCPGLTAQGAAVYDPVTGEFF
jgi:hypothetical protein